MVWDMEDAIAPPTSAWKNLDLLQYDVIPFRNEDLFGEENSIHKLSFIIKRLIPLPARKSHSVADWKTTFKEAFKHGSPIYESLDGENLRKLAIRLAVTHPKSLFDKGVWQGTKLASGHDTVIWRAAYDIFGAPWTEKNTTDKKRLAQEVNRSFDIEDTDGTSPNIQMHKNDTQMMRTDSSQTSTNESARRAATKTNKNIATTSQRREPTTQTKQQNAKISQITTTTATLSVTIEGMQKTQLI